jgi:DNA (cytosine-5)-methyltransferase 1
LTASGYAKLADTDGFGDSKGRSKVSSSSQRDFSTSDVDMRSHHCMPSSCEDYSSEGMKAGRWEDTISLARQYKPRLQLESSYETDDLSNHLVSEAQMCMDELPPIVTDMEDRYIKGGSLEIAELSVRTLRRASNIKGIHGSCPIYPHSRYEGWEPPLPVSKERHAIESFLKKDGSSTDNIQAANEHTNAGLTLEDSKDEFIEYTLDEFTMYLPSTNVHHAYELVSLNNLATKPANSIYFFDGMLCNGGIRYYVQKVPFRICSIGGYGNQIHGVGSNIWIQSSENESKLVWYRLGTPAPEYRRFHAAFLWLANFSKHFVDFAQWISDNGGLVRITCFRNDFVHYLEDVHGGALCFQRWYKQYGRPDFRQAVSANAEFLYKEVIGVDETLVTHPIWSEIRPQDMNAVPAQDLREGQTIVTPFIKKCFDKRAFSAQLKAIDPTVEVKIRRHSLGQALNLTEGMDLTTTDVLTPTSEKPLQKPQGSCGHLQIIPRDIGKSKDKEQQCKVIISSIKEGDVLGIVTDARDVSCWENADELWFVYVQAIGQTASGWKFFWVIWLYKARDTICDKMDYLYENELFMSDHCNCGDPVIGEDSVQCKVKVKFGISPRESGSGYFVRQTYLTGENSFITYEKAHLRCADRRETQTEIDKAKSRYKIGTTVLVIKQSAKNEGLGHLEPFELVSFLDEGTHGKVFLRRLLRRNKLKPTTKRTASNELVYTDDYEKADVLDIERECLVRFYTEDDAQNGTIPTPYNRDGTGDAFYIIHRLIKTGREQILQQIGDDIPKSLRQGFDPTAEAPRKLLRGMDLYCGGGNFGRGLEEGGAVSMEWAVDIDNNAIHSYHANLADPCKTKLFLGSVDDHLFQAMAGNPKKSDLIPLPGEVDFIAAGSPCQGFSLLNSARENHKGLKNQSLVASVAAYVDFYRPKYALLENVLSMASSGKRRHDNTLSQLICAFVGIGYQVQLFTLDAWSFGSPQARTRLFVSLAAPGLQPLSHPGLSHSHPLNTKDRGLGVCANGQKFGQRRRSPATFDYITAGEATANLPWLGDGRISTCIGHPDHRICIGIGKDLKAQIELIPTHPRGMNFDKAFSAGRLNGKIINTDQILMTDAERALFPNAYAKSGQQREAVGSGSKAYGRVNPDGLFNTITTMHSIQCSRSGQCLHWDQQRPLTVMEVRRAQSFPDEEVITGTPKMQWKIVGNSVARTVSLALGLSLREAWLKSSTDNEDDENITILPKLQHRFTAARPLSDERRPETGRTLSLLDRPSDDEFHSNMLARRSRDPRTFKSLKCSHKYEESSIGSAQRSLEGSETTTSKRSHIGSHVATRERPKRTKIVTAAPTQHVPDLLSNSISSSSNGGSYSTPYRYPKAAPKLAPNTGEATRSLSKDLAITRHDLLNNGNAVNTGKPSHRKLQFSVEISKIKPSVLSRNEGKVMSREDGSVKDNDKLKTSKEKYKPVDNSKFKAYSETHNLMYGKNAGST